MVESFEGFTFVTGSSMRELQETKTKELSDQANADRGEVKTKKRKNGSVVAYNGLCEPFFVNDLFPNSQIFFQCRPFG